jgi:hypothetical protein
MTGPRVAEGAVAGAIARALRPPGMVSPTPFTVEGPAAVAAPEAVVDVPSPGTVRRAAALQFSPEILGTLVARPPAAPLDNLPLADSRNGNLFTDRVDAKLQWFLPGFALVDNDPAFAFSAIQTSVDGSGRPFHRATLTLGVRALDPPDVVAARGAQPSVTLRPMPLLDVDATLQLPYTDEGGNDRIKPIPGRVEQQPDGSYRVIFDGLFGEDVVLCYTQLRVLGAATLQMSVRYRVCRPRGAPPRFPPMFEQWRFERIAVGREAFAPGRVLLPKVDVDAGGRFVRLVPRGEAAADPGDARDAYVELDQTTDIGIGLALRFGTLDYPSRFTLAVGTTTATIIDEHDLLNFHVKRSEYRELTSLGDVPAKYPSLRRLYVGDVTGTVIAVPMTYGIARGGWGCAAACYAIVDERPGSLSGCLFQLVFGLAPVIDPLDLARLARDLLTTPEAAAHEKLSLRLPNGLDPRVPATLATPTASAVAYADGLSANSLLLSVTIADSDVPAINKVNLFLASLCASIATPLFGQVAVRLDDVFEPPVQTNVFLNFHATSSGDNSDIASSVSGAPPQATVTNTAPFPLQIGRYGVYGPDGLVVTEVNETLAPGAAKALALPGGAGTDTVVLIQRTLSLGETIRKAELSRYLAFHTETVAQTRFVLGLNATGVDLGALGASEMRVQIALTELPSLAVQPMVVTPAHRVDSVSVLVPIDAVVNGLPAALEVRLTTPGGQRDVALTNDFWEQVIFIMPQAPLAQAVAAPT